MSELMTGQSGCKLISLMTQSAFNLAAGVVFALVAVLHALRLGLGWNAVIGGWEAPRWASSLGLLVAGLLAGWAFSLWLKCCNK